MPLQYDQGKITLAVETDTDGLLDAMLILLEKNLIPKKTKDSIEVKIDAILKLDVINEKLLVTF